MMKTDYSKLKRARHSMPADVESALTAQGVLDAYFERPAYQQNDYIGWISQAKQHATRQKRLEKMLSELEQGGVYMKMRHAGSAKP